MITNLRLNLLLSKIAIAFGISTLVAGPALFAQSDPTPQKPSSANAEKAADIAVTVEATPTRRPTGEIPGSFTVITADAFERQGVANLGDVVRYEPLVNAPKAATGSGNIWDGSGYTGYNIRGIEGNRVSLELDGVPQPGRLPGHGHHEERG